MCSQHYRSYRARLHSTKNERGGSRRAAGRRPPQLFYSYHSTYMSCNVGCTWLMYSLCAALYGFYAGYVRPSVTISGSIKIGNVMPYFTMLRLDQLPYLFWNSC